MCIREHHVKYEETLLHAILLHIGPMALDG